MLKLFLHAVIYIAKWTPKLDFKLKFSLATDKADYLLV
jgi:hypothetical protein